MTPKNYKDNFHSVHFENSLSSAKEVVPLFFNYYKPKTVLDVGCGLGTWLTIFKENGCDIFGVDGDYIEMDDLVIERENFKPLDLNIKFDLQKKFDLVISLEVAEHIHKENAKIFIDSLCTHSDIILFSAAIPGQEGTLHFNEQFNDYWVDFFAQNGYKCFDFFRHEIWNNPKISWWYRQNILIFIKEAEIKNANFETLIKGKAEFSNTYIHPELFKYKSSKASRLENILNNPLKILKNYLRGKNIY